MMRSAVCSGRNETVVYCHLNQGSFGKGAGIKASDYAGFYGCSSCHDWYDGRVFAGGKFVLRGGFAASREEKEAMARRAAGRTQILLLRRGLVTVEQLIEAGAYLVPEALASE